MAGYAAGLCSTDNCLVRNTVLFMQKYSFYAIFTLKNGKPSFTCCTLPAVLPTVCPLPPEMLQSAPHFQA